jgi:hypothetical protein
VRQPLAALRRHDTLAGSIPHEKRLPQLVFELQDLLAHGRLRPVHSVSRTREAALVNDAHQRLQKFKIQHAASVSRLSTDIFMEI